MQTMVTLERPASLEQIIKRSRFVGTAGPVASEQAARDFIAKVSDTTAGHNCWAWRVGQNCRCSDDGEPGGTAGKPILQAIDRLAFDRIAVVVSRWFGGILLGSGGLVRAYGGVAIACLRAGNTVDIVAVREVTIAVVFSDLALVKARLAGTVGVRIRDEHFTAEGAVLTVEFPEAQAQPMTEMVINITSGRASVVAGS